MDSGPTPDDPLETLFKGKRRWLRVPCTRTAHLESATAAYQGLALDISQGGVLFAVEDDAFYRDAEDVLRAVERAFPDGPTLVFPVEGIRLPAEIVRITTHSGQRVALGCKFREMPSDAEAALLGVRSTQIEQSEAQLRDLPFTVRPGRALSLLIFSEGEHVVGPCCLCEVQAIGEQVIEGRLVAPAGAPGPLAECLTTHAIRATLTRGRARLWEGPAHLVEIHLTPDSGAADSGAADSGAADSGAADSGAADSGAADSGAADSGAADSGAADSGAADSGAADSGTATIRIYCAQDLGPTVLRHCRRTSA